ALPESLRLVIIGGERVLPDPVRRWQQWVAKSGKHHHLQLINAYGPTETTVSATLYRIPASLSSVAGEVPIGRPLAHLDTYILDPNLQPVPIGVPGELYIGGDSLARGYLNRPDLTREKFIQNPFDSLTVKRQTHRNASSAQATEGYPPTQSKLYKTGDLARYLPDGNIEFIGRIDHQIKMRGFRIEPGEIEVALTTHPKIQQAVVIATEDNPDHKRLVGYVVLSDSSESTRQIREFLQQKLPEYMVPNAFVCLENLPLTPNGKVDRKALLASDRDFLQAHDYVAPRTSNEAIIANIFASVLGVQAPGIQDNFFELGGNSLLAIHLMSEIQQKFQKNLPLATLFQHPNVEQIANLIGSSVNIPSSSLVPIKTSGN
ncbi:MAG: non-ribosomal peptide synthetase, partial [Cyanobacteria bacterium J06635_10]